MALCGKRFSLPGSSWMRICTLDAGHDTAAGCSGPLDRAVPAAARRASKRQHAQLEAGQRAETAAAIAGGSALSSNMTPAQFAAAILQIAGESGATARELLAAMKLRIGGELVVNGRAAGVKEIKQAAARLARDGKAAFDGDLIRAA